MPLPLSCNGSFKSLRAAFSAGTRPNTNAVSIATPSVNASTGVFSPITASAGMIFCGISATRDFNPPHARRVPTAAPPVARIRLSTRSCRISLQRFAPSADRIANSFSRVVALASRRFATFPHPMSSSSPTAANTMKSVVLNRPTTRFVNDSNCTVKCFG